tara:strand:- start:3050 stop:4387 length:1338 start_codon:yes stop_codon:yes gene_type:complete
MTRRHKKNRKKAIKRPDFWWDSYQHTSGNDQLSPYRNVVIGKLVEIMKTDFDPEDCISVREADLEGKSFEERIGSRISRFGALSCLSYMQWCNLIGVPHNHLQTYAKMGKREAWEAYQVASVFELWVHVAQWLHHEQPSAIVTDLMAKAFAEMDTDNVPTELFQMPFPTFYLHLEKPMILEVPDQDHPNDNKIVGFMVTDGRTEHVQGPLLDDWHYSNRPHIKVIALRESYTKKDGEYHDGLVNSDDWFWYLDKDTVGEGHPLKGDKVNPRRHKHNKGRLSHYMTEAQNLVINALLYLNATNRKVREEKVWGEAHKRFEFLWQAQAFMLRAKTNREYKEARQRVGLQKRKKIREGHVFWIDDHKEPEESSAKGTHASPTTHWRRAHWHSYRYGAMKRADGTPIPKEKRPLRLKFLPPVRIKGRKKKEDTARTSYGMRMFTPEERS